MWVLAQPLAFWDSLQLPAWVLIYTHLFLIFTHCSVHLNPALTRILCQFVPVLTCVALACHCDFCQLICLILCFGLGLFLDLILPVRSGLSALARLPLLVRPLPTILDSCLPSVSERLFWCSLTNPAEKVFIGLHLGPTVT